jgi:hypothetical protein
MFWDFSSSRKIGCFWFNMRNLTNGVNPALPMQGKTGEHRKPQYGEEIENTIAEPDQVT